MATLSTELRRHLERTVVEARNVAEAGARSALESLAVHHHEPYGHMGGGQRKLRNRLRAHARHLGDRVDGRSGAHTIDHLVHECACEHWHGMLFARFLAENDLLIEPEIGVAMTLNECEDLAKEEDVDKWALAARFAHHMLPQVFRPNHPVFEVQLAREFRLKLEGLVEGLSVNVFTATDALGWVYQFWQTRKKDEVNRSEVKIGADELPAVTQLFTEPYMVQFLLHNSLGAWWVSRHPDKTCPVDLTYLRRTEDGTPAAGTFEGWPDDLSEFRLLDPCCGSGHFLVAAFLILVPMRMTLEGLNAAEAVDAVLRENLHGLELDQRCVAIAAFALALEAWRCPGAGGYRTLPKLSLAYCGQPIAGKKEQWLALTDGDPRLEAGMAALYDTFRDAPTLGSLIDPARSIPEDFLTAGFDELQPLLERALRKCAGEEERQETVVAALGLAEATRLLSGQYHLVVTNVPYLARGKQIERLRKFSERQYPRAKNDLANVFLERCLEFSLSEGRGVTQIVMPQNWLFLTSYRTQRQGLLKEVRWELLARLGPRAFETIGGEVVNVIVLTLTRTGSQTGHTLHGIDASEPRTGLRKAEVLRKGKIVRTSQDDQLRNPDARLTFHGQKSARLLADLADYGKGSTTGDGLRFLLRFWEFTKICNYHVKWLNSPRDSELWSGRYQVSKVRLDDSELNAQLGCRLHGQSVFDRQGIAVNKMNQLEPFLYAGEAFDDNVCPICPIDEKLLPATCAYLQSTDYHDNVRAVDQALKVTAATLVKVPFELDRWTRIARERYPQGLPEPYSNDPTQWIFHGHPCGSVTWVEDGRLITCDRLRTDATVLHIGFTRLLGYCWPAEHDTEMVLAEEQRAWTEETKALLHFADKDGIVCIPSVRGEQPAAERLLQLLQTAYSNDWHDGILATLLAESGSTSLDDWLRNRFFEQHCKLFHHRPFVWHIWDGRKAVPLVLEGRQFHWRTGQ